MTNCKLSSTLFLCIIYGLISNGQCSLNKQEDLKLKSKLIFRRQSSCSDPEMCLSQWGYCGTGSSYCGDGCQSGPCTSNGGQTGDIINDNNFQCAFNNLDDQTREQRLDGLTKSGYTPLNADEAAVFLAHVYHETGGLSTLTEYCAPGKFELISIKKSEIKQNCFFY
jgi:hypothetical protein